MGKGTIVYLTLSLIGGLFSQCTSIPEVKETKIGNQIWMAENLNTEYFRNGDKIPEAKTDEEWKKVGDERTPAWCYYKNEEKKGEKYGKLYNWYAVNDERGLAPDGWHIPSKNEFEILKAAVNRDGNALKAWGHGRNNEIGTNTSGFSALLAGFRESDGKFLFRYFRTYFWSSTEGSNVTNAYFLLLLRKVRLPQEEYKKGIK